jgi:flagellar biosynthesis protein FliQ
MDAFDREFALAESRELRAAALKYVDVITATERLALAGAAAVAAFSVSDVTAALAEAQVYVSFIPALILSLAALRCLTLYWVLQAVLEYLEEMESACLSAPDLGFQRRYGRRGRRINRAIEAVSGAFWALAVAAALLFWALVNGMV